MFIRKCSLIKVTYGWTHVDSSDSFDGDREHSDVYAKSASYSRELPWKFVYCALEGRRSALAGSVEKGNENKEKIKKIRPLFLKSVIGLSHGVN